MKGHALPRVSLPTMLGTLLTFPLLVGTGYAITHGHSKYLIMLAVVGVYVALAMRQRGVLIGLLVLAAMDGIPFFTATHTAAPKVTYQDLATFGLIGTALVWLVVSPAPSRPTRTARRVSLVAFALFVWCFVVILRSDARFLSAFRFGSDFVAFGALLVVLPRVQLRTSEIRALVAVLGIGTVLFSIGQILFVEGVAHLTWLVHASGAVKQLGLTRVYAGMNDMLTCGVSFSIAYAVLSHDRRRQLLAIAISALLGTSLVIQLTRARWIALVGSLLLVTLWFAFQGERRVAGRLRSRMGTLLGVAGAGVVATLLVSPSALSSGAVVQRFLSIFTDIGSSNSATSNVAVRTHVAKAMLGVLGGQWPFGVGLVPPTTHFYSTLPLGSLRDVDLGVFNAIMTIGVIGAVLIYAPLVIVLLRCMRSARAHVVELPWLNYGGQIWLVATLVSSLTLVTLFSKSGVVMSAVVVALLCQRQVTGEAELPEETHPIRGSPWLTP